MTAHTILVFLHVLAVSVVLGGEAFLQFIVYPVLLHGQKNIKKDSPFVRIYDISAPVVFGSAIVIVITGILLIFRLYDYFQDEAGGVLIYVAIKIAAIILTLAMSAYQTFSLRAKMTGIHAFQKDIPDIVSLAKTSKMCSLIIIISLLVALFAGIKMS